MARLIRWLRDHPNVIALGLVVGVAVGTVVALTNEAEHRADRDAALTDELCRTVNEQQVLLRDLIDVAVADGGSGSIMDLPEWHALDPETRAFFIAAYSRGDGGSTSERLKAFAEERLVPADCVTPRP